MKTISIALFAALFTLPTYAAPTVPQLYCVSSVGYGAMIRISLFTNEKGTLRSTAEITDQEGDTGETGNLVTIKSLKYDEATRTISSGPTAKDNVQIVIDEKTITLDDAKQLFPKGHDEDGEYTLYPEITFTKYYTATIKAFSIAKAKKTSYQDFLNLALSKPDSKLICGDFKDIDKEAQKATLNFWNDLSKD